MLHLLAIIPLEAIVGKEQILEWVGYIITALTTGSVGWIASVKYNRQQAKADAMKSVQDVYQELVADLKNDREELKAENAELRESMHKMEEKMAKMQEEMHKLTKRCSENESKLLAADKKFIAIQPMICTVPDCPGRCGNKF